MQNISNVTVHNPKAKQRYFDDEEVGTIPLDDVPSGGTNTTTSSEEAQQRVEIIEFGLFGSNVFSGASKRSRYLRGGAVVTLVAIPLLCLFAWLLDDPDEVFPWPIYPAAIAIELLCLHMILTSTDPKETTARKGYHIHVVTFCIVGVVLLISNMLTSRFPWAMYPISFMSIFFGYHSISYLSKELPQNQNVFIFHAFSFAVITTMLFITWCYNKTAVPWFIFPALIWGALLAGHYLYLKKRQHITPTFSTSGGSVTFATSSVGEGASTSVHPPYPSSALHTFTDADDTVRAKPVSQFVVPTPPVTAES